MLFNGTTDSQSQGHDVCVPEIRERGAVLVSSVSELRPEHYAWLSASILTVFATFLSFFLIIRHFHYYYKPEQQRHIVRILLMVPIYAVCSLLSMFYIDDAVYFEATKNCYEAFVLYSFFALLTVYLGTSEEAQHAIMQTKKVGRMPAPLCCIPYDPRRESFLLQIKRCVLQYVVVHPITSALEVILQSNGMLCAESMSIQYPYFWLTAIEFTSVSVSMYALVLFYIVASEDLKPYGPIPKFLAVKFVIFFSFWQAIMISILESAGVIADTAGMTATDLKVLTQGVLICLEMVIAAFLHIKAFNYSPFMPPYNSSATVPIWLGLKDTLNLGDIVSEVDWLWRKRALDEEAVEDDDENAPPPMLGDLKLTKLVPKPLRDVVGNAGDLNDPETQRTVRLQNMRLDGDKSKAAAVLAKLEKLRLQRSDDDLGGIMGGPDGQYAQLACRDENELALHKTGKKASQGQLHEESNDSPVAQKARYDYLPTVALDEDDDARYMNHATKPSKQ